MFTDAYLGPSRTSAMELFLELFLQKKVSRNVRLGSKYPTGSADAPCKMESQNSFILQYLCHSQFVFSFQK